MCRGLGVAAVLGCVAVGHAQEDAEPAAPPEKAAGASSLPEGISEGDVNTRFEARLTFANLVDAERYDDAMDVGERLLALTEQQTGPQSRNTAIVLTGLAEVQRRAGFHGPSEENFLRSIEILRSTDGVYSEAIIDPLVGLGSNYHDNGDYLEALTVFNEAHAVNRRVFGLLNEEQIDIMDRMTITLSSMNRFAEADQQQVAALQLMERKHGIDTPEILPAIYKYAAWLRSSGLFQLERNYYARAMNIIRKDFGRESTEMVKPLREIGNSFRTQKLGEGQGISSLKRALELLQAREDPDPLAMAETLRDLGDWYVAFSKVGPTGQEYRTAWRLLEEVENGEELQREWFGEPDYVLYESPSPRGVSSVQEPGMVPGHVLVVFDVDEFGRADNVVVAEAVPPGLKNESTARSLRRSRFRPRIVDGELAATQRLARRFVYYYEPEE